MMIGEQEKQNAQANKNCSQEIKKPVQVSKQADAHIGSLV